jgi:transcriptional regulator with XRE-family HTH domain
MYPPGLRLRQTRESLGLTYRDVEQASYEIAAKRGRPEFILHISRLADIENRNVVPSLYKLYSLATIYHLSSVEISSWYEAPFQQTFDDGAAFPAPLTHLYEFPKSLPMAGTENPALDSETTGLLKEFPASVAHFPGSGTQTIPLWVHRTYRPAHGSYPAAGQHGSGGYPTEKD